MNGDKETIKFYEEKAHTYFKHTKDLVLNEEINRFVNLCGFNATVLDIGPGSGRDLKEFSKLGITAKGAEISVKMAEIAKNYSCCEVVICNADKLPFTNNAFNGVWAKASLHHIPYSKIDKTMSEIKRIVMPGGIFYSSVKIGQGEKYVPIENYKRFYAFYSIDEYVNVIKNANFEIIDFYTSKSINPARPHDFINVFARKEK